MRILLDTEACDMTASSVGEALAGAAGIAEARGRVIVDVRVDGQSCSDEDLGNAEFQARAASEVQLLTADLRELVVQTLQDANDALRIADSRQHDAAKDLQGGRSIEAMGKLGESLQIWQDVQQAVLKSIQALAIGIDRVPITGEIPSRRISKLGEQLGSLKTALASNDPVEIADMLMYELPETVLEWRELLEAICEMVRGDIIRGSAVLERPAHG